jgi:hypothetical protein
LSKATTILFPPRSHALPYRTSQNNNPPPLHSQNDNDIVKYNFIGAYSRKRVSVSLGFSYFDIRTLATPLVAEERFFAKALFLFT